MQMDSSYGKERSAELQYEDPQYDEETPRSELPPSLDGWDAGNDAAAGSSSHHPNVGAIDYFTTNGLSRPTLSQTSSSPAPSTGISEATAPGLIQLPSRSRSVRSSGRPSAHTAISSLSVLSTDSTVTVRPSEAVQILEYVSEHPPFVQAPYPNQSYAALHEQYHPTRGNYSLRRVGSQPFHHASNSASAMAIKHASGARSTNNTPTLSAGLFNLPPQPALSPSDAAGTTYASPFLHYTHKHVPKETHVADVDVDPISGRKLINHYEIIDELGRGAHGKVKLGRDLQQDNSYVAIKIVERFSRRRRLGRLGTTENKVKKEVAILKKVRHPNVVALLEVIDDPTRKKVYIVLEWVENGEIKWRRDTAPEIAMVEARRYARERSGRTDPRNVAEDDAVLAEAEKQLARKKRRQARAYKLTKKGLSDADHGWSLEMAGDSGSDSDDDSRSLSRVSTATTDSFQSRHPAGIGGRRSRQSSRVSSHGEHALSGSPSQFIPLTEPVYGSPEDRRPLTARSGGPESSLFSNYEFGSAPVSRGASLTSMRSIRRSSDDLVRYSKEVLNSELDPELSYVPVMTIEQIRVAFRDTLLGLRYLHYQGIVHRDIKPPNLLSTVQGRVKISDFGVSYLGRPVHDGERAEDLSEADTQDLDDEAKELAKTVGTPAFYAPEMCNTDPNEESLPVTKAIDVWALGITLFCMLFARTPFVDEQYVVMRQIADEEVYLPRKRLCPVSPKPSSRASSGTRSAASDVSVYRHELDLVYEPISDDLHDLMQCLLTKDPRQRITLEQVRKHPWVVADLPNPEKWLEETDISRQSEGRKIDVSKREVDDAVVPLTLVERVRGSLKKAGTAILGLANSSGRRRADSSASNSPAPSVADETSVRDPRRESLQGEQDLAVYDRLKASRGWHMGQAQSELVQRIDLERDRRPSTTHVYHFGPDESGDEQEYDSRPYPSPPSRANTLVSTATSMATVRQSDYRKSISGESRSSSPGQAGHAAAQAAGSSSHLGGIFGGATRRIMNSVRERASHGSLHRVRSHDAHSVHSTELVDPYAEPTTAVSSAVAAAQMDPLETSGENSPAESALSSVAHTPSAMRSGRESAASSRPTSTLASPEQPYITQEHYGFLTRNSSGSSMTSASRKGSLAAIYRHREQQQRQSTDEVPAEDWKRVDEEHIRRAVQRSKADAARAVSPRRAYDSPEPTNCPPSPDDSKAKHENSLSAVPSLTDSSIPETPPGASPGTHATHLPTALPPSSYDLGSTVAIAASEAAPSGGANTASFDQMETFSFHGRDKRGPSSDDTVGSDHGVAPETACRVPPPKTAKFAVNDDDDDDDDDYESSSDSDGGLVMSRRKSSARAAVVGAQQTQSGSAIAVDGDAPLETRRSSRSGSSNTMKKVRTQDSQGATLRHPRGRIPFDLGGDEDEDN